MVTRLKIQNGSEEYLAHHGIVGQKWGIRNGPPYPLDRSKILANSNVYRLDSWGRTK